MRRMRSAAARSSAEDERDDEEDVEEEEEEEGEEGEYEQNDEIDEKHQQKLGGAEDDDNRQNAHLASAKLGYSEQIPFEEQVAALENKLLSSSQDAEQDVEPHELPREERGQPDLVVTACNGWQQQQQQHSHNQDEHAESCTSDVVAEEGAEDHESCCERQGSLRCSVRRRAHSAVQQGDTVDTDSRLSLPVGALESKQEVGNEPWWMLAPVSSGESQCSCNMPWQQGNAHWIPHAHTPAWAVTPYRATAEQQSPPFASRLRRRAPPPPPPKPTCEQVATVRRASSVLPDGTTRRSVTFHADSVTYIPPPPPPPPTQGDDDVAYIPPMLGVDQDAHTCLCTLHNQPTLGAEGLETTLVVRGLERVPGLAARELIDALERRLGPALLRQTVRGVCLHQARPAATVVAATVSVSRRDVALRLLVAGIEARGEPLQLEEEEALANAAGTRWRGGPEQDQDPGHVLLVSGVTHQVSDSAVRAAVLRASGLRACQVRRHVYKGVDTGERLVRVTAPCHALKQLGNSSQPPSIEISTSSGAAELVSTDNESKYRTHLSVQLRRPQESTASTASPSEATNAEQNRPAVRPATLQLSDTTSTEVRTPSSPQSPRHVASAPQHPQLQQNVPHSPGSPGPPRAPPSPQMGANAPRPPALCNGPISPPPYTPPPPPSVPVRKPSVQPANRPEVHEESKQRASVNFEERAGARKKASGQQNGGILRRGDDTQGRRAAKSRSVSVESSRVSSGPQRRRHGVFERPSSEELLLEGRASVSSSREGSNSRIIIPPSGSLPWCGCWGNGCI